MLSFVLDFSFFAQNTTSKHWHALTPTSPKTTYGYSSLHRIAPKRMHYFCYCGSCWFSARWVIAIHYTRPEIRLQGIMHVLPGIILFSSFKFRDILFCFVWSSDEVHEAYEAYQAFIHAWAWECPLNLRPKTQWPALRWINTLRVKTPSSASDLHQMRYWFSGSMRYCHSRDPSSILGYCIFFFCLVCVFYTLCLVCYVYIIPWCEVYS